MHIQRTTESTSKVESAPEKYGQLTGKISMQYAVVLEEESMVQVRVRGTKDFALLESRKTRRAKYGIRIVGPRKTGMAH